MPGDLIRADYDQLQEVAKRFASAAQTVQEMNDKIADAYNNLIGDHNWVGTAANAFVLEDMKTWESQNNLVKALEEAGQVTERIAQSLKQAEEEASNPFKQLFGG
jgi:WXG100 family type VII secretion target